VTFVPAAVVRAGLIAGWLAVFLNAHAEGNSSYSLRWVTNVKPPTVKVSGLDTNLLRQLRATGEPVSEYQKILSVYAGQGDFLSEISVPPMLGGYRVEADSLVFQPQFPLERGVVYRAVFRPGQLTGGGGSRSNLVARFQLPPVQQNPTTVVTQIYPTADPLPENLLKFYVHFSAAMQSGHIYNHIHLRDESGKPVELPFLEIDEELWNPEMTRLTLFIDPGRIKRGVQPLEEIGPALEAGKGYTLEIDANWQDLNSFPLREGFRKSFRVGAPDREPPSTATWKIKTPKAGTRDALTVDFFEPMDHALALRVIRVVVAGQLASGKSALTDHEQRWTFTPLESWKAGLHQLQVQNTIEDLAGNNIGKAFEVDLFEGVQRQFTNSVVKLEFEVK
jgi:hypothetical protein